MALGSQGWMVPLNGLNKFELPRQTFWGAEEEVEPLSVKLIEENELSISHLTVQNVDDPASNSGAIYLALEQRSLERSDKNIQNEVPGYKNYQPETSR